MLTLIGRILLTLIFGPILLIPFFFYGSGCYMCWRQDYRIDHFLATPAVVRSAGVSSHRGSGKNHSTNYTPEITYEYDVSGKHYESSDVLPLGRVSTSDSDWARDIIRPFKAGRQTTAWYNASDPSQAFIAKRYSFFAPTMVLFAAPFVLIFPGAVGSVILSAWIVRRPQAAIGGGFYLPPTMTVRRLRFYGIAATIFWYLPATIALLDFYGRVHRAPTIGESIGIAAYLLLGMLLLLFALKEWRISRFMGTPRVCCNAESAEIGQTILVEIEQEFHQFCRRDVTVKLQCQFLRSGKNTKTETISEQTQPAQTMSGQSIGTATDHFTFKIPSDARPTTARHGTPGYSWRIAVVTKFENQFEQPTYFPLEVKAADATQPR